MNLTPENKNYIDNLSYCQLLEHWRFAPIGDKWFQGETGDYWVKIMAEKKENSNHIAVSKIIGWDR